MPAIDKLVSPNNKFTHSIKRFVRDAGYVGWELIFRNINIRGQLLTVNTFCELTNQRFADAIEIILNNNISSPGYIFILYDGANLYRHFIKIKGYDTLHIKALNPAGLRTFEIGLTGTFDLVPYIQDDVVSSAISPM